MFKPSKVGKVKISITTSDKHEIYTFDTTVAEATGIAGVKDDSQPATGKYYNLNGQEVDRPTKGIFIKKGKKIVIP